MKKVFLITYNGCELFNIEIREVLESFDGTDIYVNNVPFAVGSNQTIKEELSKAEEEFLNKLN